MASIQRAPDGRHASANQTCKQPAQHTSQPPAVCAADGEAGHLRGPRPDLCACKHCRSNTIQPAPDQGFMLGGNDDASRAPGLSRAALVPVGLRAKAPSLVLAQPPPVSSWGFSCDLLVAAPNTRCHRRLRKWGCGSLPCQVMAPDSSLVIRTGAVVRSSCAMSMDTAPMG